MKAKLGNEGFLSKAPSDVVDELRERLAEAETASARLTEARERLAAL
jgi:valyl-tRNA synthetase